MRKRALTLAGFMLLTVYVSGQVDINTNLLGFGTTSVDTGISRDSASVLDVGNGTAGDKSGSLNLFQIVGTGTIKAATLNATSQVQVNSMQIASANLSDGASLVTMTGTQNLTNKTLGSLFLMTGSTMGTTTIQTAAYAGTPTITWPSVSGTLLNSAMASCQILDNAICTSSVDGNGNPNFISLSSTTIQIGAAGPVTYFVGGVYQQLVTTLTIPNCGSTAPCYATPGGETEFFIFVQQDTAHLNPVAADLVITSCVPLVSYTAPSSGCSSPSATNPQYWYNLATNIMMVCTATCGTSTNFTVPLKPLILLGVAAISATPTVDAFVAMPYRLNPYEQFKQFSDGASGVLARTSGSVTQDGEFHYTGCLLSGATLTHSHPSSTLNTPGLLISCQTPMLLVGSASINATGSGRAGVAGTSGMCASVSAASGFGAGGGGSGGSAAPFAGCNGGAHAAFCCSATTVGAGANGASGGGSGGVGGDSNAGWVSGGLLPMSSRELMPYAWGMGAPGAPGSGGGTGAGTGGTAGSGGGVAIVKVPSLYIGSSASIACNGGNATAGTGGSPFGGGGGGGGGGTCGYIAGFSASGTTGITANGGTAGAAGGAGAGAGAAGGTGNIVAVKLW